MPAYILSKSYSPGGPIVKQVCLEADSDVSALHAARAHFKTRGSQVQVVASTAPITPNDLCVIEISEKFDESEVRATGA